MVCNKNLKDLKVQLKSYWEKNLNQYGVKFPREGQRLNCILCLFENLNKPISQNEMLDWFEKNKLPKYDRQARHLADDGWYIVGGNSRLTRCKIDPSLKRDQLKLKSLKKPNPIWFENDKKREGFLESKTWKEILEVFKDRGCAVCGVKHDHYDQGHLEFGEYTYNNIVPMCSSCNNWGQMYNLEFKLTSGLIARPIIVK
jgi:hypothetical protein